MYVTACARWRTCRNATERSPSSNSGCTRNGFTPSCYLQLSLGEQKRRLHRRLDHPEKRWKLTLGDLRDHRHFADHQAQWAEVLGAPTATRHPGT